MNNLTPENQALLAIWQQHTYAEIVLKDADAALATMTETSAMCKIHFSAINGSGPSNSIASWASAAFATFRCPLPS